MCIDFTDLNKYCPTNCYPLPSTEQKVAATVGYEVLFFLDLYKVYHQVLMDPADIEKNSLHHRLRERGGCFLTRRYHLGSKTPLPHMTYQCLVGYVFKRQIDKNIVIYVDDIVMKSKSLEDFSKDLEQTLEALHCYGLKLKPSKCSFGV